MTMKSSNSAVILLSGGLDSCVTSAIAVQERGFRPLFLNVYYGQRHSRERISAEAIAQYFGGPLIPINLTGFGSEVAKGTVLTNPDAKLRDVAIDQMGDGQAPTYVPGRNTVMLAIAQSLAEAHDADCVFTGVNHVDYSGYVDCRPAFIRAFNDLATVATFRGINGRPIWVEAPLIEMSKVDIIRKGVELGAPLDLSWSCYAGGNAPCHVCDSCKIREAAFNEVGLQDTLSPLIDQLADTRAPQHRR